MRKVWMLFLCLIASSLVVTTAVHAREWMSDTALQCSGDVHTDGDSDQSKGDVDKAAPHHHGSCHGQFASVNTSDGPGHAVFGKTVFAGRNPAAMRTRTVDPALRPPTA